MTNTIENFVAELNERIEKEWIADGSKLSFDYYEIRIGGGRKYTKLLRENSVVAFIEKETGDIYKPAGWSKPAKHVRGNINSEERGLEAFNFCGGLAFVNYL